MPFFRLHETLQAFPDRLQAVKPLVTWHVCSRSAGQAAPWQPAALLVLPSCWVLPERSSSYTDFPGSSQD